MTRRWPPSDFSGRAGRCGVQATAPREFGAAFAQQLVQRLARWRRRPSTGCRRAPIGRRSRFGRSNCGSGNDTASPSSPSARASSGEASISSASRCISPAGLRRSLSDSSLLAAGGLFPPPLRGRVREGGRVCRAGASSDGPHPRPLPARGRVSGEACAASASTSAPYARRKNPRAGPTNCPAAACSPGLRADARGSLRDAGIEQLLQRGRDRRQRLARRLGARRARGVLGFLRVGGFRHGPNMGRGKRRGKGGSSHLNHDRFPLAARCWSALQGSAGREALPVSFILRLPRSGNWCDIEYDPGQTLKAHARTEASHGRCSSSVDSGRCGQRGTSSRDRPLPVRRRLPRHGVSRRRAVAPVREPACLKRIERISSVSGGSITAGMLGLKWRELSFDPAKLKNDFVPKVVAPLRALAGETLDAEADRAGIDHCPAASAIASPAPTRNIFRRQDAAGSAGPAALRH